MKVNVTEIPKQTAYLNIILSVSGLTPERNERRKLQQDSIKGAIIGGDTDRMGGSRQWSGRTRL